MEYNAFGLNSPLSIERLISKMDLIVTTRLHGMVLGIKNEVPVIAVDPIEGGAKITNQAKAIDWPYQFSVAGANQENLSQALSDCLKPGIRSQIRHSRELASAGVLAMRNELQSYFSNAKKK